MLETLLGIKITHLGAGFAGGTVRYILLGGPWLQGVTSVIAGSLTAAYLTTPCYFAIVRYLPNLNDPTTEQPVAFIVGLTGLLICEGIMNYVKKRRDSFISDTAARPSPRPSSSVPAPTPSNPGE